MKRRKKIWIACAALAVVVALCALALINRPMQYEFLRGSELVHAHTWFAPVAKTHTRRVTYDYRMSGSYEEVWTAAKGELLESDGWIRADVEQSSVFILRVDESSVIIYKPQFGPEFESVTVTVTSDATFLDRIIAWMNGGER